MLYQTDVLTYTLGHDAYYNNTQFIVFLCVQAAESGNVEDFMRLYLSEPSRLAVRDGRGRTAAHQAAARNNTNILHFINNYGGGK